MNHMIYLLLSDGNLILKVTFAGLLGIPKSNFIHPFFQSVGAVQPTCHVYTKEPQAEPQIAMELEISAGWFNLKHIWNRIGKYWIMFGPKLPSIYTCVIFKKSTFSVCARLQESAPVCAKVRSLCAPFCGHQTHKNPQTLSNFPLITYQLLN